MKIESMKRPTTEVYVQCDDSAFVVTAWANCEGANVMMTNNDLSVRLACAMRWEEIDALIVALAAARSA